MSAAGVQRTPEVRQPIRTCVGCRMRAGQTELFRVVADGPRLRLDPRRRLPGRGAYVHVGCVDRALERGGLSRGLRVRISAQAAEDLRRQLSDHAEGEQQREQRH